MLLPPQYQALRAVAVGIRTFNGHGEKEHISHPKRVGEDGAPGMKDSVVALETREGARVLKYLDTRMRPVLIKYCIQTIGNSMLQPITVVSSRTTQSAQKA